MKKPSLKLVITITLLLGLYLLLVTDFTSYNYGCGIMTDDISNLSLPLGVHRIKVSTCRDRFEYFIYRNIPRLVNKTNNAILNTKDKCIFEEHPVSSKAYMTVVTNYHPPDGKNYNPKAYDSSAPTVKELQARKAEILNTLQDNLNNTLVSRMYVLVQDYESAAFLNSLDFVHSEKLVIHWTNEEILLAKTMNYISKCLQNKIVLMIHQDNRIGRGFENINRDVLVQNKLMYALTRQPSIKSCYHSLKEANCAVGKYVGSHDAFMFHVKEFTNSDFDYLELTNAGAHNLGMENVFLWLFKNRLEYKILNPCKVLYIHHEHCVPIRKKKYRRINNEVSSWIDYDNGLS